MTGLRPVRPWKLGWLSPPGSGDVEPGETRDESRLGAAPVCGASPSAVEAGSDENACPAPGAEVDAIVLLPPLEGCAPSIRAHTRSKLCRVLRLSAVQGRS